MCRAFPRIAVLGAIVALVATCDDIPFEPGMEVQANFDVSALLQTAGDAPIPIDEVIVRITREDGELALQESYDPDSLVPAPGDSVSIRVMVSLRGSSETFDYTVTLVGGGFNWFVVTGTVTVAAGTPATTAPTTASYVGPGANATSVIISLGDTTITGGDSILVSAAVFENQTEIPEAPVYFESSDETKVAKPVQAGRNQAWVFAPAGP